MKKIAAKDQKEIRELLDVLQTQREAVENQVQAILASIDTMIDDLRVKHIAEYNQTLEALREKLQDQASQIESYRDERSEKWQESDAASAYESWLERLDIESAGVEDVEIVEYQQLEELADMLAQNSDALAELPFSLEDVS